MKQAAKDIRVALWASKILRWLLGLAFVFAGFHEGKDMYTMAFGALIFATGFLRPRCIGGSCRIK